MNWGARRAPVLECRLAGRIVDEVVNVANQRALGTGLPLCAREAPHLRSLCDAFCVVLFDPQRQVGKGQHQASVVTSFTMACRRSAGRGRPGPFCGAPDSSLVLLPFPSGHRWQRPCKTCPPEAQDLSATGSGSGMQGHQRGAQSRIGEHGHQLSVAAFAARPR